MENTLYTDGHGIMVTTSEFVTGKTSYKIAGIINAHVRLLKRTLTPALVLVILGVAGVITGFFHLYSNIAMDPFYVGNTIITANRLAIIAGFVLFVAGLALTAFLHDKYAVHIVTAEGDKEPVVSDRKQYIQQIVSALQKALRLEGRLH